MAGPQQVVDVDQRLFAEAPDRLAIDDQDFGAERLLDPNPVGAELTVLRPVGAEREQRLEMVHRGGSGSGAAAPL
jgi:hypothetical protein